MTHDEHQSLPGYHPDQISVDGCKECERRAAKFGLWLLHMDGDHFRQAWQRASDFNRSEGRESEILPTLSKLEQPHLDSLWAVILMLERGGIPPTIFPPDLVRR